MKKINFKEFFENKKSRNIFIGCVAGAVVLVVAGVVTVVCLHKSPKQNVAENTSSTMTEGSETETETEIETTTEVDTSMTVENGGAVEGVEIDAPVTPEVDEGTLVPPVVVEPTPEPTPEPSAPSSNPVSQQRAEAVEVAPSEVIVDRDGGGAQTMDFQRMNFDNEDGSMDGFDYTYGEYTERWVYDTHGNKALLGGYYVYVGYSENAMHAHIPYCNKLFEENGKYGYMASTIIPISLRNEQLQPYVVFFSWDETN